MSDDKSPVAIPPTSRRSRRLRMTGIIVLAAGIIAAGVVYWLGLREADLNDKLSMQGFNRAERRQMGQLYGKSGQLIEDWADDLEQPGTQALLIGGFSVVVFAGCFYFARLLEYDNENRASQVADHQPSRRR